LKEDPNLDRAQNNKLNREKSQKQSKYQSKWQSEECRKARRCHASHAEMQLLGHFFRRHYLRYQRATLVGSDEMDYIQSFEDWQTEKSIEILVSRPLCAECKRFLLVFSRYTGIRVIIKAHGKIEMDTKDEASGAYIYW
jgi:hypothetical protein